MKKNYAIKIAIAFLAGLAMLPEKMYSQLTTITYSYTGTIQNFTVPPSCVGSVSLDVRGAGGGSVNTSCTANGGLGARMQGVITVTPGQVLSILVGQVGTSNGSDAGGGGGSFVATGTVPLIVAGGGGGASNNVGSCGNNLNGLNATITTSATASANGLVLGGTGGNGGGASTGSGSGGGGFYTNGTNGSGNANGGGKSFLVGGAGGTGFNSNHGGFGGGGCGWHTGGNGGGGGGYSGGGTSGNSPYSGGGGGSSYNSGTSQVNTAGFQSGNGLIILSYQTGTPISPVATSTQICSGNSATLSASGPLTFTWSNSSTSSSIVVNPTSTTNYTVQGTDAQNCVSSAVITVTVNSGPPSLSVAASASQVCLGKTVTLTATGAITYTWSGGISNGVSFTPTATTVYTVNGQNGCGISSAVTTISIGPLPVVASANQTLVCSGKPTTLTAITAGTQFTWQPTAPNSSLVVVSPTANVVYSVAVTDGTCIGAATTAVQVNPNPTITSTSSGSAICSGNSATLTASGGINYTWTPGNTTGSIIVVTPSASIQYSVTGDNSVNCLSGSSQVVIVSQPPTVSVSVSDPLVCVGGSCALIATGTASTYAWSTSATGNSIIVNPLLSTTYTVTGTDPIGCTQTANASITVFDPTLTVTSNTTICSGNSINLQALGADSYTWNIGTGIPFPGVTVTPSVTTIYSVSAETSTGNITCPSSATVQITVNPTPTVSATPNRSVVCKGETFVLTGSGASNYTWSPSSSTNASITVNASLVTTYNYSVVGTDANGCSASATVSVKSNACVGIEGMAKTNEIFSIYPNPNNGNFSIASETNMELVIYNNVGQKVASVVLNEMNNHKASVTKLSSGIYFIQNGNEKTTIKKVVIE